MTPFQRPYSQAGTGRALQEQCSAISKRDGKRCTRYTTYFVDIAGVRLFYCPSHRKGKVQK